MLQLTPAKAGLRLNDVIPAPNAAKKVAKRPAKCGIATFLEPFFPFHHSVAKRPAKCGIATVI